MAKPSAGSESRPRRDAWAANKTAAIAAARRTEGDGRTSAINAARARAVASNR